MSQILIVDDEEAVCWALRKALQAEGHQVAVAASAEDAFEIAKKEIIDAVFLDFRLPGLDGLSALSQLRDLTNDAPIILATAFGNLSVAVKAVENGVFDYLAKPFDLDQALETVNRALQRRSRQESTLPQESRPVSASEEIIGVSPAMQNIFKRIALVSPRDASVLIMGESGTGKELVARAVHRYSARKDCPFLPVHIASLNPTLVESELFGHVKGAFTGAVQSRPGLLAMANGGTVFFDEIADIPIPIQVKLLRVLEHRELFPVGSNQPQAINLRVLAATHQSMERQVAEGHFRHDLFFRLNVFQIHVPPLRERKDDILALTQHFLHSLEPRAWPLLPATETFLMEQTWPGNVRQLHNALEHAVIVARGGPLLPEHFPPYPEWSSPSAAEQLTQAVSRWIQERIRAADEASPNNLYEELLRCVEPPLFAEVIRRLHGNRVLAGQWLGLNRATVRKKLGQFGLLETPRSEEDEE
jgi:two-component system nitrogen regulation response regulator GlnG